MQELKEDEIVQINGGGVPLAVVAVKLVTWAVATVGGAAVWLGNSTSRDKKMMRDIKRSCHRCNTKIPVVQRVLAIYDWSIQCNKCGHLMETSFTVLFVNILISQFFALLVVRTMFVARDLNFFILTEFWALLVFLPVISIFSFGVVRH